MSYTVPEPAMGAPVKAVPHIPVFCFLKCPFAASTFNLSFCILHYSPELIKGTCLEEQLYAGTFPRAWLWIPPGDGQERISPFIGL